MILLNKEKKRYLSKNNLNYKRIHIINKIFPLSRFLITFREPLQHAFSLYNQHINFKKIQSKNNFVKRYMNYLGHNEFGLDHKSWYSPKNYQNFSCLNYWIEQWIIFYQNILDKHKNNKSCLFIKYESFQNIEYKKDLLKILGLNYDLKLEQKLNNKEVNIDYDKNLYLFASDLYSKLNSLSFLK